MPTVVTFPGLSLAEIRGLTLHQVRSLFEYHRKHGGR